MPDEQSKAPLDNRESEVQEAFIEIPMPPVEGFMDQVTYTYSNVVQIMSNNLDVRIAFGDRIPPTGKVKPLLGITLTHAHAQRLATALQQNIERTEGMAAKGVLGTLPHELVGGVGFEALNAPDGTLLSVKMKLADGGEKIIQGDQLSKEIRDFITLLQSKAKKPAK